MDQINMVEGSRLHIPYDLKYGQAWSVAADRNTEVLKSQLADPGVFFVVKDQDANTIFDLDDNVAGEIDWDNESAVAGDSDAGKFSVKIASAETQTKAEDKLVYELRIKLSSGQYITVDRGRMNLLESLIDAA